jgi:hypothetical protein
MTVVAHRKLVLRTKWLSRVGRDYSYSYRAGVCHLGVMTNLNVRVRLAVKCCNKSHDVAVHLLQPCKPGNPVHDMAPSPRDFYDMFSLHILLMSSPDVSSDVFSSPPQQYH